MAVSKIFQIVLYSIISYSICHVFFICSIEMWRRVKYVESWQSNVHFVFCVDYGSQRVVEASHLRQLPEELESIPFVAIECKFSGAHRFTQKTLAMLRSALLPNTFFHAIFKKDTNEILHLFVGDADVTQMMLCTLGSTLLPTASRAERHL